MSLNGKVALVTGGAQGIGRAVVQSLLQSSAKVSHCASLHVFNRNAQLNLKWHNFTASAFRWKLKSCVFWLNCFSTSNSAAAAAQTHNLFWPHCFDLTRMPLRGTVCLFAVVYWFNLNGLTTLTGFMYWTALMCWIHSFVSHFSFAVFYCPWLRRCLPAFECFVKVMHMLKQGQY